VAWTVEFHDAFAEEFAELDVEVKISIEAGVIALREFGPQLGRPQSIH